MTTTTSSQPAERRTFTESMQSLLHPKRIAVVGDSPNRGFASGIRANIVAGGYQGEIFPVNPRYEEIASLKAYPTVDAIPGGVDLAIVGVQARFVEDVLEHCAAAGAGAINIITSGYGEQSDELAHERQAHLRDFAERTGIRIVGPNCLGNISTPNRMLAITGPFDGFVQGPVGLVLQSGLLAYSLVIPVAKRGIGFSYVVTTGNEVDLDATDLMRYYIEDDHTRVIGCFIEQFRRPDKLLEVAQLAAERQKPIVVLKIGSSEAGRRSALAHTGSLVGSDAVADTVLRQAGIIRVRSLDEMTETLAAFHTDRLPQGPGVGAIYVSGGAAGLVSDLSEDLGIELPELAPATIERLNAVIPEYGTVGNPLDTTGMAGAIPEILQGAIEGMAEDPSIHTIVYGQAYPTWVDLDTPAGEVMRVSHERYPDKTFLVISLVPGVMFPAHRRDGEDAHEPVSHWGGVPFLHGVENGLRAVAHLNHYATFLREGRWSKRPALEPSPLATQARAMVQASGGKPLAEQDAKQLLALYGIPTPKSALATSAEEAVTTAQEIGGPVVLKIVSPEITHKTDAGGVMLNLSGEEAIRTAYEQIISNARAYDPDASLDGVLVEEMSKPGHEIILGMSRDPDFGPAIAVGLGGVFVETLGDVALGVPPLSTDDAHEMLDRLRGKTILEGVRGQPPADTAALASAIERFAQLCVDLGDEVMEIDINPLVVYGESQGICSLDCLIIPTAQPATIKHVTNH